MIMQFPRRANRLRGPRVPALSAIALGLVLAVILAACSAPSRHGGATGPTTAAHGIRIAAVFSGPVSDHDFNQLGLDALQALARDGATTAYTENVAPEDAAQEMRRYATEGNSVIWAHGGQFYDAAVAVAREHPTITFITEYDGHPAEQPANVWILDRQFHLGFYAVGALASELTRTGIVGYVGGLPLPFSYAEVHAMRQAFHDSGAVTTLRAVWTGDFNDVAKARAAAKALIGEGADVIVGSLNGGGTGLFDAAAAESTGGRHIWVTTKYTDKALMDPGGNRAGALLYDFAWPLQYVTAKIRGGEHTGYYPMGLASGVDLRVSPDVSADARRAAQLAISRINDGRVEVAEDTAPVSG